MNRNTSRNKCIHCGQLVLRKISKFDATRCQILRLKCTKVDFRWGSARNPASGVDSAPHADLLAVFNGDLLLRAGRGIRTGREWKEERKGRRAREGEERGGMEEWRGEEICRTSVKLIPYAPADEDADRCSQWLSGQSEARELHFQRMPQPHQMLMRVNIRRLVCISFSQSVLVL